MGVDVQAVIDAAVVTCHGCPFQMHGVLPAGRWFYFRERFGTAALTLGDDVENAAQRQVGGEGVFVESPMLDEAEARRVAADLLAEALRQEADA